MNFLINSVENALKFKEMGTTYGKVVTVVGRERQDRAQLR